jgi:Protein of unknown function (DUF2500)/Ribosomal protein L7/L12 C-terminal domain
LGEPIRGIAMDNFDPLFIAAVLFVVLVLGIIGYYLYNLAQPTVTRKARVTGKRKGMSRSGDGGTSGYHCTFEFEDGRRQEYDVSVDMYVSLADGDVGYLDTKGVLFRGFRPEREGGPAPSGPPTSASIPEKPFARIKAALSRGQKIEAIRLYRECTGAGLAEAKAAVEQLDSELRAAEPDKFAGPAGG